MPDFKFVKGFVTGALVTDLVISTGLLLLTWQTFKPSSQYGRFNNYSRRRKYEYDKWFSPLPDDRYER